MVSSSSARRPTEVSDFLGLATDAQKNGSTWPPGPCSAVILGDLRLEIDYHRQEILIDGLNAEQHSQR